MDLGFKNAGFNIIWANEIDHWACETYRGYFGNHIIESDVAEIIKEEIPDSDIILGGFPCQDFSVIWKRGGLETERGNLYSYFVRIVKWKQPKMFIAENVKGLLSANNGMAVEQIKSDFEKTGYNVNVYKINFADYGTPQFRHRILILGIHKDFNNIFILPEITHGPGKDKYMSAKEALEGVEKVPYNNEHQNIAEKTREMLKLIPPGGNFTSVPKESQYYVKGMISHVYRRLNPHEPSTTIIAGGGGELGGTIMPNLGPLLIESVPDYSDIQMILYLKVLLQKLEDKLAIQYLQLVYFQ